MTAASSFGSTGESTKVQYPSPLPIILGVGSLVVSAFLVVLQISGNHSLTMHVLGYVFSPFGVVGALAWARSEHLKRSDNPWYDVSRGERTLTTLQALAAFSFLVGVVHAWQIGVILTQGMG